MSEAMKTIHRIYFNFEKKEDIFAGYLKNWEEKLPDFNIIHWDASNLPMDVNPWVEKLYQKKDHAFLSDYFRWYLLLHHGGVYLDGDVEVVDGDAFRKVIEDLETAKDYEAVIGIDERSGGWYTAHSMAAKPGSQIAQYMCRLYGSLDPFIPLRKKLYFFFAPQLTSLYFASQGHNEDGLGASPNLSEPTVRAGVRILPQDWFSPLAPAPECSRPFVLNALTPNTTLCHHFACTWHEEGSRYMEHAREIGGQTCVKVADLQDDGEVAVFQPGEQGLATKVGKISDDGMICGNGKSGHLLYGPGMTLYPGQYEAVIKLAKTARPSRSTMEIVSQAGGVVHNAKTWRPLAPAEDELRLAFDLTDVVSDLEVRLNVRRSTKLSISSLSILRRPDAV